MPYGLERHRRFRRVRPFQLAVDTGTRPILFRYENEKEWRLTGYTSKTPDYVRKIVEDVKSGRPLGPGGQRASDIGATSTEEREVQRPRRRF